MSVKICSMSLANRLVFLLCLFMFFPTAALAVQTSIDGYFCAEDISNVGTCNANEVSLSGITNVVVTDINDNEITECQAGQQVKIQTLEAKLDSNTGTRYDVTFWVGKEGNDPRVGGQGPQACTVLSLPDNTGSSFIADFEGGDKTDSCLDLEQPDDPIDISFGGTGAIVTCADSDDDHVADVQILTTWWQNKNFFCGAGNQTYPFDLEDPVFSPGSPAKCDFVTIPIGLDVVEPPASLTIVKSSTGDTDTFSFSTTGFDAASPLDNGTDSFTLNTGSANPASVTDNNITISDVDNGDTFSVTEDADADWNLVSATCNNGDTPDSVTLLPGDEVTCTFTNVLIPVEGNSITIVKSAIGGDGTFSFDGGEDIGTFDLETENGTDSMTFTNLEPGNYTVKETVPTSWDLADISCSSSGTPDYDDDEVDIVLGESDNITCTFTNTLRGAISIFKTTSPDSSDVFAFTHDVTGLTVPSSPFNVTAGDTLAQPQFIDVPPGTYTIMESDPTPGYDLDNIVCTDGDFNGVTSTTDVPNRTATINLDPGELVQCTFDNFRRGSLRIIKEVALDGPDVNDFDFESTALGNFSLEDVTVATPRNKLFENLVSDDYDVSEVDPSANGWALLSATCNNDADLMADGSVFVDVGEDVECTFVNDLLSRIVYIEVTKQFTDGNTETPVTLSLNCSSGTYAPASVTVTPDEFGVVKHIFPVRSVPLSGIPECTVVEEPVPGYATEYRCPQEDADSTSDPSCVPVEDDVPEDNFACKWTDVELGDWNRCTIFNDPEPVAVEVTKVWEQNGTGGDFVKEKAEITIYCDAWIVNGYYRHGKWKLRETLKGWDGDFPDGVGTVTAWVVPEWYPSDSGESTVCWAREDNVDSAVEVESDCGDSEYPGMEVSVRTGGDSCTITNTLFFEGIPTMSRYGLAVMALLMLGLGAVGFRRFV